MASRRFKLTDKIEVFTPSPYDSMNTTMEKRMNRTNLSDKFQVPTALKVRRNSTNFHSAQASYELVNGIEHGGPGPGQYSMHSDFGQIESNRTLVKHIETQFVGNVPKDKSRSGVGAIS